MKKVLGRGLDSLFGTQSEELEESPKQVKTETVVVNEPKNIDIGLIDRNPNQPRKNFNEDALNELAESIKNHGVIQPIIVKENSGRYVIIAGERRWRASRIAGLKSVPCVIKDYTDREISEIAIIENLQREDLNPIESARAIKSLIEQYSLTQEEVADKIGKSRPSVANTLRLLSLPEQIVSLVEENKLSAGHAKALLMVEDAIRQKEIALKVLQNGLSVRETEQLAKKPQQVQKQQSPQKEKSLEINDFENKLKQIFATKVEIKGNEKKGKVVIDYYTKDDLDRIYALLIEK